ncbi:hypothetical protein O3G_MSEX012955 [Manduca sexta]|uniref:Peptidase S1 domain-containing protein n=1 Tax=Manduca sexta TaxID=7130 RepID=A0A922CWB5_MANSE|nr:hypothetical protein O3G_MSEX012955 [Manduca sexta]KAG6461946.1 hypothetical protein O3G_MSEX012955 [Manduca sexta]
MLLQEALTLFIFYTLFGCSLQDIKPKCSKCIFYGKEASIREFPYFAALKGCGAAILSDTWLVTAAHCVENPRMNPGNKVWVGGESISNSQEITFKRTVIHPQYRTLQQIPINDIALLELTNKLNFTDKIKPIRLGVSRGSKVVFVGKGLDETGRESKSIKKLELTRLTTKQCLSEIPLNMQRIVLPYIKELEKVNICARRTEDQPGICMGDSGSPLTQNNQLIGLASYVGNKDCRKTRLNFFTNVPTYTSWIKSVTKLK